MIFIKLYYQVPATQNSGWLNLEKRKVKNKGLACLKELSLSYSGHGKYMELSKIKKKTRERSTERSILFYPTSQDVNLKSNPTPSYIYF